MSWRNPRTTLADGPAQISLAAVAAGTAAAVTLAAFVVLTSQNGVALDSVLATCVGGLAVATVVLADWVRRGRRSHAQLAQIVHTAPDAILVSDASGTIVFASAQVEPLLGYEASELVGQAIDRLVPTDRVTRHAEHRAAYRAHPVQRPMGVNMRLAARRRDGSTIPVDIALGPLGSADLVTSIVRDARERAAAASRLRALSERLQAIVEHSPVAISVRDLDGRYELANDAFRRMARTDAVLDRTDLDLFRADEAGIARANDGRVVAEDRPETFEETFTVDGETRIFLTAKVPLHDEDGRPAAICSVATDITDRVASELATSRNAKHVETLLEAAPDPMVGIDEDGRVSVANRETERFLGYTAAELQGSRLEFLWPPHLRNEYRDRFAEFVLSGRRTGRVDDVLVRRCDGEDVPVELSLHVVDTERGRLTLVTARDISDRLRYETRLTAELEERRAAERKLAQRAAQQAAVAALGGQALERQPVSDLINVAVREVTSTLGARASVVRRRSRHEGEQTEGGRIVAPIGVGPTPYGILLVEGHGDRVFDQDEIDFAQAMANVLADALELERTEDEMRHRALHDPLTGLPNRALFSDRLGHALGSQSRSQTHLAVMFVDLDRFKLINDSLGHQAGDELLRALPGRVLGCLRPNDTLARLGGDEFVVLCENLDGGWEAAAIAMRILAGLEDPFVVGEDRIVVSASIGIAIAEPGGVQRADELMRDADAAMYAAKERGRARVEIFEGPVHQRSVERLRMETALRGALEEEALGVGYQPIVDARSGRVEAVEALLRWEDAELGAVSPADLIPLAEETGLIVPVGNWVLRTACRQLGEWRSQPGGEHLRLAVNLSPRQLADASIVPVVTEALAAADLTPDVLDLEITESVLLDSALVHQSVLMLLSASGVMLHLDDFGTGYSSLTYLKRFPIDAIKIDRSFVAGLGSDAEDDTIVSVLVNLAHGLGLRVVAEGVETAEQFAHLRRLGCEAAQGYYFAPALPAHRIPGLLTAVLGGTEV